MSKKLGGWQRLGIVLTIAWTLGVGSLVWIHWPDLDQMQADHLQFGTNLHTQAFDLHPYDPPPGPDWVDPAVWEVFQRERSGVILVGLVLWLVPLFGVAIVGYTSRWVYRGFRLQRESPTEDVSPEEQRPGGPAEDGHPMTSKSSSATQGRSNVTKNPIVDLASSAAGCSEARRVTAKRCPSCGLPNREAAEQCVCGYNFASGLASVEEIQFEFIGQGRDILSGHGLKMLLQYVSIIGIPWGWLTTLRWVTRKVSLNTGTDLRFEGTVGEAGGFMALFMFLNLMNRWDFSNAKLFADAPVFLAVTALAWMAVLWALTAFIQLNVLKWEIERTSLSSGAKPVFRGGFWASCGWQALTIVSIFTVIGWAWVGAAYFRWVCRNTDVNGYQGRFEGSGLQVFWRFLAAILACIPIVTIPAIFCWWQRWFFSQVKGILEPTIVRA